MDIDQLSLVKAEMLMVGDRINIGNGMETIISKTVINKTMVVFITGDGIDNREMPVRLSCFIPTEK